MHSVSMTVSNKNLFFKAPFLNTVTLCILGTVSDLGQTLTDCVLQLFLDIYNLNLCGFCQDCVL